MAKTVLERVEGASGLTKEQIITSLMLFFVLSMFGLGFLLGEMRQYQDNQEIIKAYEDTCVCPYVQPLNLPSWSNISVS